MTAMLVIEDTQVEVCPRYLITTIVHVVIIAGNLLRKIP
jgi:hypothetical protein